MSIRLVLAVPLALGIGIPVGDAGAAPKSAPKSAAQPASIDTLRKAAVARFRGAKFAEALVLRRRIDLALAQGGYVQLRALNRYHIARCLDHLGRQREAALMLVEVVAVLRDALEGEARARLEHLRTAELGRIVARCVRSGLKVTVEGIEPVAQPCGTEWDLLEPGEYMVYWRSDSGLSRATRVDVRAGRSTPASLRLEPSPVVSDSVRWALTGGAVAALGLGAAFYGLGLDAIDDGDEAERRFHDARGRRERRDALDDTRAADDELGTWRTLSYGFGGVGVLLAGGAIWSWLATDGGGTQAVVEPQLGPAWVGATVHF